MPAPPIFNSFEGGTDTTVISAANSGASSGNAFNTIVGSPTFSTEQSAHGSLSMKIVPGISGAAPIYPRWDALGTITTSVYFRWYMYVTALPVTNVYNQMYARTQANANCMTLILTTAGKIRMANAAGSTVGSDGTVTVNTNAWFRIECRVLPSTTVGQIEWRLFNTPDSTTADEAPAATTGLVLGADVGEAAFGFVAVTGSSSAMTIYYDDLAISTSGWIGPSVGGDTAPSSRVVPLMLRRFDLGLKPLLGFPLYGATPATALFNQPLTADTVLATASMQRQTNKALTATSVGVTASMLRIVNKALTATTVLVTASIQKQVNKILTATSVVVTASLQALKVILKVMTATTVVVTASIQKQANKPLVATTIAVTASIQKQVNKILTATSVVVTATLQALKVILKALTATTVVVTAAIVKQVNKPLVATTLAVTASIQKQVNKKLTATTVVVTATLQALKVVLKAMTATTVVVTASMVRQVQTHISATVALSASITKLITHRMSATVNAIGDLVASLVTPLVGPFAGSLHVSDLITYAAAVTDAILADASGADATGADATTVDAAGGDAVVSDLSGFDVTALDPPN